MVRQNILRSAVLLRLVSVALCVVTLLSCYRALYLHLAPPLFSSSSSSSSLSSTQRIRAFLWGEVSWKLIEKPQEPAERQDRQSPVSLPDPRGPRGEIHRRSFLLRSDPEQHWVRTPSGRLCLRQGTRDWTQPDQDRPGTRDWTQPDQDRPGIGLIQAKQNNSRQDLSSAKSSGCVCKPGWHGPHCGVPTMVQHSNLATKRRLAPRAEPRRVINAININHEFDLLHARFHELNIAVDLFLVCESNYTAYGTPKPLTFLRLLLNGTFDYIRKKILYVFLDHFPSGGHQNGWLADDYLRTFLTRDGLARVEGLRTDDVFILNDADEIPARDGVLFLKLYNGWTEPVSFHMRKSLYGFYWKQPGTLDILSGCTIAMLKAVYQTDGILLRRRYYFDLPGYYDYQKTSGRLLVSWSVGSPVHYAGWHCSWCFTLEGILHKLVSAQNGDFPRWGDYKEKRDLSYIKNLVRTGGWFDGSMGEYSATSFSEPMFAPRYLLENYHTYRHMLENPYAL